MTETKHGLGVYVATSVGGGQHEHTRSHNVAAARESGPRGGFLVNGAVRLYERSPGFFFDTEQPGAYGPEHVQAALSHVTDFTHATVPEEDGTIGNHSPQLQQIFQGPRPGPASKLWVWYTPESGRL